MESYESLSSIVDWINENSYSGIIGIEGFSGSGKSTLADAVAREIGCTVIHTDDFAVKHKCPPKYTACLNVNELKSAIDRVVKNGLVVVEGICLRDVMESLGLELHKTIYVKRLSMYGFWHDVVLLNEFEAGISTNRSEPHLSDFKYHAAYKPHEICDIVYEWRE